MERPPGDRLDFAASIRGSERRIQIEENLFARLRYEPDIEGIFGCRIDGLPVASRLVCDLAQGFRAVQAHCKRMCGLRERYLVQLLLSADFLFAPVSFLMMFYEVLRAL